MLEYQLKKANDVSLGSQKGQKSYPELPHKGFFTPHNPNKADRFASPKSKHSFNYRSDFMQPRYQRLDYASERGAINNFDQKNHHVHKNADVLDSLVRKLHNMDMRDKKTRYPFSCR